MMLPSPVRFSRRPLMDSDGRVDQIASERPQPSQYAILVRAGEPAVSDHIRDKDRGKSSSLAIYDCSATIGSATANSCPPKFRERISRLKMEVWERCHPNVRDCERIFDDVKKRFHSIGLDIFGDFTIEKKDTWPPLMVADMLAHTYSMARANDAAGILPAGAIQPAKTLKGALAFLELAPNALADLKAGYVRFRQLEIEEWRQRRDARRKSAASSRRESS